MTAGFAGTAKAEDVQLEAVMVRSGEECRAVLDRFGWYCAHFDDKFWQEVYGDTYWNLTANESTPVYFVDADEDGLQDVIVSEMWGCGVRGCSRLLLFGDQRGETGFFGFTVSSDGPLFKAMCEDGPGVRFGKETHCFSSNFIKSQRWMKFESKGE
jgi:hypothetical protein